MHIKDLIRCLLRARYPLLWILSQEEMRVLATLNEVACRERMKLLVWTVTKGLVPYQALAKAWLEGRPDEAKPVNEDTQDYLGVLHFIPRYMGEAIFVLLDFHHFLSNPVVIRALKDLAREIAPQQKTTIILSPTLNIPPDLEKEIQIIDFPLPTKEELAAILENIIANLPEETEDGKPTTFALTEEDKEALVRSLQGLTAQEAESVLLQAAVRLGGLTPEAIKIVTEAKKAILRNSRALEFYPTHDLSLEHVGGLDLLKAWLKERAKAFTDKAREYGLPWPKGVLLVGVPGTGKSLSAKTIAAEWGLPLLYLSMGAIFQGVVGASEENIRTALKTAEAIAPCVLWLDEIEKGLAGLQSSSFSDAGTTARVLGILLTWLQEHSAPVVLVATANDPNALPPELLRRFDDIFALDLPTFEERIAIFSIHLRKRNRDPENFDLALLASETEGFTGAEIEKAVVAGMFKAFAQDREVTTEDILEACREIVPISRTKADEIQALRNWAIGRARPASKSAGPNTGGWV